MRKAICFVLVLVLVGTAGATWALSGEKPEEAVVRLVESFGRRLRNVPLQAPRHTLAQCMVEQYGDFVAPPLLAKWIDNPLDAPGRLVSSPWPDRIEINGVHAVSQNAWAVQGFIVELTSEEHEPAARRPITLVVTKQKGGRWLIDTVILGDYH